MEKNSRRDTEIALLYSVTVDDIDRGKRRQWAMTYYILVTYAAIIIFHGLLDASVPADEIHRLRWTLSVITFLLNLLGMWHLANIHGRMYTYRRKLERIEEQFSESTKRISRSEAEESQGRYQYYFWDFTISLSLLLSVGMAFVVYFITYGDPELTGFLNWMMLHASLFMVLFNAYHAQKSGALS